MATQDKKKSTAPKLGWKRENHWPKLKPAECRKLESYCGDYLKFLSQAKTEREAHDLTVAQAQAAGYRDLDQIVAKGETLHEGDCVFRSNRGKTIMLARLGRKPLVEGLRILGAHTDAPRLDAKPNPIYEDSDMVLMDTHYYGGIKKYQWVTLPLAIHGVVIKENGDKVVINIGEDPGDPVFVITDLLPHLGQEQAKKTMSEGVTGEGLNVLLGSVPVADTAENKEVKEKVKEHLLRLLFDKYGICEEDFASAELEVVPAGQAREVGFDRSMLLGYGHDDRICAYASLRALLDLKKTPEYTSVVLLCDKEEIGSVGATGMDSTFFENTVASLISCQAANYSDLLLRRSLERSSMLSADVSALHDPNYPEVSSPNNMARLNAGVVVSKYTGSRGKSGSSDASAEFMAKLRRIFNADGVAWQSAELGKVDVGGGGTIALFLARYGMDVVDCGVGLLSMHAPWEVAGKLDTYMAYKSYAAFLKAGS
jgi:aspartyl aminopeptidase